MTTTEDTLTNTNSGDGISDVQNNKHDDKMIDSENDFDDEIDNEDDRDDDTENVNRLLSKHIRSKRRKENKKNSKVRKSVISIKKSFIPKPYDKNLRRQDRTKASKKPNYKKPSSNDDVNDSSNFYERLRNELKTSNNLNNKHLALAKLVATILQKKLTSRTNGKRLKNLKSHKHSWDKKKKNSNLSAKEVQAPFHNTWSVTNTKILLQNLLTNTRDAQSRLKVEKKQSAPEKKVSAKATGKEREKLKMTTKKPLTQADMKMFLLKFLPNFLSTTTNLTTAPPIPTVQPTMATTHTPNQNVGIHNLLNKLGINGNLKETMADMLQGLLSSKKGEDGLSVNKMSATQRSAPVVPGLTSPEARQTFPFPNSSQLSSPNPSERLFEKATKLDNLAGSHISTAKPMINYLLAPTTNQPLPSPIPPTYANKVRNAAITPPSLRTGDTTANQSLYGYSVFQSRNSNPNSYETSSINILCFGDSLTSGYYNHGRGKHPYSIRLNQLLNAGGQHHFKIVTQGKVGEMVHGSMTKRLPKVLNQGLRFDWVIILGGTNDVAHVKNFGDDEEFTRELINVWSPKIVKDIEKLHETARRYGARTVLITIPETAYELWPEFQSIRYMRLSVNSALRQYVTQVRDTTVLCDLAVKLPRSSLSSELRKFYWNDHIHLNPVGYDKMAEIIGQCIRPYLTK